MKSSVAKPEVMASEQKESKLKESQIVLLQQFKKEGNTAYGKKKYNDALKLYQQSLQSIGIKVYSNNNNNNNDNGTDNEYYKKILQEIQDNININNNKILKEEISKIFSNRAACYLNLKKYNKCIHNSNLSLLYNRDNEKALFRRARSYELKKNI